MSKSVTVAQLAQQADMDLDDALADLWDAGIDEVLDPDDLIPPKMLKAAEQALNVVNHKQQLRIDYWLERTGLTRIEFEEMASSIGVRIKPNMRKLPKGGLRRIKRQFQTVQPKIQQTETEPVEIPPFKWFQVGNRRPSAYLFEEDILGIHESLVLDFAMSDDPISPSEVRDVNLIGSAISRQHTSLGHELKYETVEMAAAALMHSLVFNHCFYNGNKRTALVSMLAFLDMNSVIATCTENDLYQFTLNVARHKIVDSRYDQLDDREVLEMALWIRSNSRRVEKGERPIPWLRLRRILNRYNCDFSTDTGKGNRLIIQRRVENRGRIRRKKRALLESRVTWSGDGSTVGRGVLHQIRKDLELDAEHGVDSKVFYEAEAEPDDFIQVYRKVLNRLARL